MASLALFKKMLALCVREKYLEVSVENVELVESAQAADSLDEHAPDFLLLEKFLPLLALHYLLVQIPVVCKFHYDAASGQFYHRFFPSRNTYLYPIMFLVFRLARMRTSFSAF